MISLESECVCAYACVHMCGSEKRVCVISPLHCPLQVNNKANTVTSPKDTGPAPALVYTHTTSPTPAPSSAKPLPLPHLTPHCGRGTGSPFHWGPDHFLVYKNVQHIMGDNMGEMDVQFNFRLSLNEIVCKSFCACAACLSSNIFDTAKYER